MVGNREKCTLIKVNAGNLRICGKPGCTPRTALMYRHGQVIMTLGEYALFAAHTVDPCHKLAPLLSAPANAKTISAHRTKFRAVYAPIGPVQIFVFRRFIVMKKKGGGDNLMSTEPAVKRSAAIGKTNMPE